MLKNVSLLAVGLAAGLVIMMLTGPQPDSTALSLGDSLDADGAPLSYDAVARAEAEARIAALEERIARLEAQRPIDATASAPAAGSTGYTRVPAIPREPAPETIARNSPQPEPPTAETLAAQAAERELQLLVRGGGFTPDRAEWIRRKVDEARMEELRARYEAQRAGTAWPANDLDAALVDRRLRAELGEADYERYLRAIGRITRVQVGGVIAGSPAATAGVRPGDQIVSYGGKRVFGQPDLNAFILEGTPGETVVVEIERNGQRLQVVVPRGPIGITGGIAIRMTDSYGITTGR